MTPRMWILRTTDALDETHHYLVVVDDLVTGDRRGFHPPSGQHRPEQHRKAAVHYLDLRMTQPFDWNCLQSVDEKREPGGTLWVYIEPDEKQS